VCTGDAGWGGDTPGEVLRHGGRVQRHGDGAAGAQPGGPLQLLQQAANQNIKFINKFKVDFIFIFILGGMVYIFVDIIPQWVRTRVP
jgi:hypothetical protein